MWLLYLLITFVIVYVFFKSPTGKGIWGEFSVGVVLGFNKINKKYTINNFSFNIERKTIQIDHLLINKKGVFVIETKNYRGRIYGDEYSQKWIQVLNYGKSKYKLYNPIKQNKSHIYYLKKLLNDFNLEYHSIIVFYNNTTKYIKAKTPVIQVPQLRNQIRKTASKKLFTEEEINKVYIYLMDYKKENRISRRKHIRNVKKRLNNIGENICPRCGGLLVNKSGKYGEFIGCSNYPKCRFIKK